MFSGVGAVPPTHPSSPRRPTPGRVSETPRQSITYPWVPSIHPCVLTCGSAKTGWREAALENGAIPPQSTCAQRRGEDVVRRLWPRCSVARREPLSAGATVSDREVLIGSPHEDADVTTARSGGGSGHQTSGWRPLRCRPGRGTAPIRVRSGVVERPERVTVVTETTPQVSAAG